MIDFFRFLRVGLINIIGVTVPGMLLLCLFALGVLLPISAAFIRLCQVLSGSEETACVSILSDLWGANRMIFLALFLVFSYIAGYILRLLTPDGLDERSALLVLKRMDQEAGKDGGQAAAEDKWPVRMDETGTKLEKEGKFPYKHFKEYLTARGHHDLAALVRWEESATPLEFPIPAKRSKTHVNIVKLEILTRAPDLSAMVESNEAHVRLMFGTWTAVDTCWWPVVTGTLVSLLNLSVIGICMYTAGHSAHSPAGLLCLFGVALLVCMHWAKAKIENLFHYQRVRELTHIIACLHLARTRGHSVDKTAST